MHTVPQNEATGPISAVAFTIMVIDDNHFNREILAEYIRDEGHEALAFESALAAMEALKTGAHADIIMVDYMMPNMNGLEFLQELRSDARFAHIPAIMVSAHPSKGAVLGGNEAGIGVVGFLEKPFDREDLLEVLGKAIGQVMQAEAANGRYGEAG